MLACALGLLVIIIGLSLIVDRGDRWGLRRTIRPVALEGAALVAVTCTFGSLYLSEIADFRPCRLCWIQRGFMYPAALVLVVAAIAKRPKLGLIGGALALFGLPVSIFHRVEQSVGEIGGTCSLDNPCSARWVNHFEFITIPTMAGVGFVGILVFVALSWRTQ